MAESERKAGKWSLESLMEDSGAEAIEAKFREFEERTSALEGLRAKLSPSGLGIKDFKGMLASLESFASSARVLGAYAALRFSADTTDTQALSLMGRVEQVLAEARNRVLFVELWWKSLEQDEAGRLLEHAGDLRYYLLQQRLLRPHTLSEPEERVITLKDVSGASALETLYDMITSKYAFSFEAGGVKAERVSRDELMSHTRHQRAEVREAAYRELYRVYGEEAPVLGHIYASRVRDWANENLGLRHFSSPLAVRNMANDVPGAVVDTLLEVVESKAAIFHRYFQRKAGWLGLTRLRRFDLYAPPALEEAERKVPYGQAVEMVLGSFERFSPEVSALARKVFDEVRVDAELRRGKRGGAFCYSVLPESSPWVLLNYTGEPREVATMAHEMGHAVHSLLASHHSVLSFGASLPMAETASVFGEMLLTDRLLSDETDSAVRNSILVDTLDGIYATVLRQAFFVLFEREAHALIGQGASVEELHEAYLKNLARQFGPSVEVDPVFKYEWVSIPHIYHAPFYCYAYSFGMLLSLSLYARYKAEGAAFAPVLRRILSHGGAASPEDILREAGIDMRSREFWAGGFEVVEEMIRRLED